MAKLKDPGQGVLLLWGEDGLQEVKEDATAVEPTLGLDDVPGPEETISVPMPLRSPLGQPLGSAYRPLSSFSQMSETKKVGKEEIVRVRAGDREDWNFCNDPEEYVRESELRKQKRQAKETADKIRQRPSIFARAVDALSRRDYSKKELTAKLLRGLKKDEDPDEVEKAIVRLETLGYLSDQRFAENRARVRSSSLGDARIRRELRQSGISQEKVAVAMETIEEPEEVRAYRVWLRRYKELPTDRKERDRQIRYLLYRGFSMDSINRVLRGRVELPEGPTSFWA